MSDAQERVLAEAIKNKMIGILKAEEIFPGVAKLREEILNMSNREIERASKIIASRVHRFCMKMKASGQPLQAEMINNKVKKELESAFNYEEKKG